MARADKTKENKKGGKYGQIRTETGFLEPLLCIFLPIDFILQKL
jgi:hypothetical protein